MASCRGNLPRGSDAGPVITDAENHPNGGYGADGSPRPMDSLDEDRVVPRSQVPPMLKLSRTIVHRVRAPAKCAPARPRPVRPPRPPLPPSAALRAAQARPLVGSASYGRAATSGVSIARRRAAMLRLLRPTLRAQQRATGRLGASKCAGIAMARGPSEGRVLAVGGDAGDDAGAGVGAGAPRAADGRRGRERSASDADLCDSFAGELSSPVREQERPSRRHAFLAMPRAPRGAAQPQPSSVRPRQAMAANDVAEFVKSLPREFFQCIERLHELRRSGKITSREFAIAGSVATTQYGAQAHVAWQRSALGAVGGAAEAGPARGDAPPTFHTPRGARAGARSA